MDLSGFIGPPTGATGITGFRFIAGVDPQNKAKVNSPLQSRQPWCLPYGTSKLLPGILRPGGVSRE